MRQILADATGAPCPYCDHPMTGERAPSRDHIRPRSKGFTLADPRNRAIVCQPCNEDKGSRSLASFLFRLQRAGDPRAQFVAVFIATSGGPRTAHIAPLEFSSPIQRPHRTRTGGLLMPGKVPSRPLKEWCGKRTVLWSRRGNVFADTVQTWPAGAEVQKFA